VLHVQRHALPAIEHVQRRCRRRVLRALLGPLLRAPLAIQHIGAGDLVVAAAHQAQFGLVLHVFDMEGAAARA